MPRIIFPTNSRLKICFLVVIFSVLSTIGCAVEAAKKVSKISVEKVTVAAPENLSAKNSISIQKDSPADTVRVFYKDLCEKRFRDALFLTNLRPAIEGLTDAELKDLQVDFANLARQIPAEIEINGEIIVGDKATVTAKLPDNDTEKNALQEIRLRRAEQGDVWVILTVDEEAEKIIKREGKNYFFNLKIETHEREAKDMLNRIAKAELVYAAQNGGLYAEMPVLIEKELLPADAQTAESTGYNYKIFVSADHKKYSATAEPAIYGKTGKMSFNFEMNDGKTSGLKSRDAKASQSSAN